MGKDLVQKAEEYSKAFPDCQEVAKKSWLAGYDAGKRSKSSKKELDLSFVPADYLPIIERWVKYKQERKQAYTQSGIEACYLKNGTGTQFSFSQNQSPGNRKESVERLADLAGGVLQGLASKLD